ncbi:uncharacterized protein LOC112166673 [Rosa chinensis]|uniref:uncharacterized protein LOC112166673 n=1 Tax=Rosa chinensis TaxID=74649 RepID=UPI000D090A18|nr:uncharacterized protein LOC112166673 [Rosa chinensis]
MANYGPYFVQTRDGTRRVSISTEQKLTCAMRMLAYDITADFYDDYLDIAKSTAIEILDHFTKAIWNVDKRHYGQCYYLVDGIYPKWGSFVQAIRNPRTPQRQHFTRMQEAYRKDAERAFGILQARWAIIRGPTRGWSKENLQYIMMTCIILHNMIVKDEHDEDAADPFNPNDIPTRPKKAGIYARPKIDTDVNRNPQ